MIDETKAGEEGMGNSGDVGCEEESNSIIFIIEYP